jgi:transcriptional regulator with XRE-family HTH domain
VQASRFVRWARLHAGLSQQELAARTGVAQSTISRIEGGALDPRVGTVRKLLRACGADLELGPRRGVEYDRTELRAQLGREPAARLRHAVAAANNLRRWHGVARRQAGRRLDA